MLFHACPRISSNVFGLPIVTFNKRTGPVCAIRNVGLKKGHGIKIPWVERQFNVNLS